MLATTLAAALAALAGGAPPVPPADAPGTTSPRATPPADAPGATSTRAPAPGSRPAAPEKKPLPPAAVLGDVVGTVRSVDRVRHRIVVDTRAGPEELQLDRNTLVYVSRRLGTVLDVQPGVRVRAGRNADALAYWVAVQVPEPERQAAPTTGQGANATGGAGPPPGERGSPATPAGGSPPAPGSVTAPGGTR